MKFRTRRWVKYGDLNSHGTLFGGTLLQWIDEEAAIYASCQLRTTKIVTKYMSEIDFQYSARNGDIVELGFETLHFGRTSITVKCVARKKFTHEVIITVDKIVFVHLDHEGKPVPHGITSSPHEDEPLTNLIKPGQS